MENITGWAVIKDGEVTPVARPETLVLPNDAGIMGVPAEMPMNDELLSTFKECGYFPIITDNPDHDPNDGRLVFDGYEVDSECVKGLWHVEPHPEESEVEDLPVYVQGLRDRDEQLEASITGVREYVDTALSVVNWDSETAEIVSDRMGELDRLVDRLKEGLGG